MTRDCEIDIEAAEKALEEGDVKGLLDMVSPDIEERGLTDALILAETSEIPSLSPEERLDLLGQAIFIAYYFREEFEDYEQLLQYSAHLAAQQLLKKMELLGMKPDLLEEPVGVIGKLYPKPEDLYSNQKFEALRISQAYFYYYLYSIDNAPPEEKDDFRGYTFALGGLAVGYASAAGCFCECLGMAEITTDLMEAIDTDRWFESKPEGTWHDIRKLLHGVALKAIKAARELHKDSDAEEWAGLADTLSGSLAVTGDRRSSQNESGDVFLALGKAAKALDTFKKIKNDPHLSEQDRKDAIRKEELVEFYVTGDWENILNAVFPESLNIKEKRDFKGIFDSAATGNFTQAEFAELMGLMEKAIGKDTAKQTDDMANLFDLFKLSHAISQAFTARDNGDINGLLRQLPNIEKVARGDSINQLMAASSLIYLRQGRGESITWQSLAPLANRLFDLPSLLFLVNFAVLTTILYKMDSREFIKGADTVAALVESFTFYDERTPLTSINQSAIAMPFMDFLLALLVKIAECIPAEADSWLERAARLKYFVAYRAQKQQKDVKLFNYTRELSHGDVCEVKRLVEVLTHNSLVTLGRDGGAKSKVEKQLNALLFPIYSRYRSSYNTTPFDSRFPEIIHVEVPSMPGETSMPPLISIMYTGREWRTYTEPNRPKKNCVEKYMEFIKVPYDLIKNYNNMNSISNGVKLREALIPFSDKAASFPVIGVRSTGVYHTVPLDSLPLEVDENAGRVTRWVGEETVTVLLTGENQELGELYKPKNVTNVVIFANSSFRGIGLSDLPGVEYEAGAIQRIVRTKSNASSFSYFGSRSTRDNFLRLSGSGAPGILHIATHGIVNSKEPTGSCIVLSRKDHYGNKVLAAVGYHDIMLMDLRKCNLVVLSACSTHEGKNILGEGIMGLAWAFKAAGAKAVIGTRWQVDDTASIEFWRKFYENIFDNRPIGEAFQGARIHIMKQEKWNHPYYWGVFQLIV